MAELYETDVLAWSERQAELIRRLAAGERVNADIDWPHVADEVHDVGISELRACESLLQQAMRHLVKLALSPESDASGHWQDEIGVFLDDAARRYAPSMRQRIVVQDLYARAVLRSSAARAATARIVAAQGQDDVAKLPDACPWNLDDLLQGDIPTLLTRLRPPA